MKEKNKKEKESKKAIQDDKSKEQKNGKHKRISLLTCLLLATLVILSTVLVLTKTIKKQNINTPLSDKDTVIGHAENETDTTTIQFKDENFYKVLKRSYTIISSDDANLTITMKNSDIKNVTYISYPSYFGAVSDISGIENFTNLTELDLYNNEISDISPLSNLTNLTDLNLCTNQISDISPLSNLTNLTYLALNENQISDISALSNLTNLTCLELNENQISDISPLSNLTNLTYLDFTYNEISDNVSTRTYQLPNIIAWTINPDGVVRGIYSSENSLYLENCTLSKDKHSIILNDGLTINDKVIVSTRGNSSTSNITLTLTPSGEYVKAPEPIISYTPNNSDWTSSSITAKLKFDKENIEITNNDGSDTYTFDQNGSFTFTYKDGLNGRTGSAKAIVDNIDKENPVTPTELELNATTSEIKAKANGSSDVISGLAGYQYSTDNTNWSETVSQGISWKKSGIEKGTNVTVYARAVDNTGNVSESISKEITTLLGKVNITATPDNSTWTKENVNVTLSHDDVSGYTLQYKIGNDGKWTDYEGTLTIDKNNTVVYGRMYNEVLSNVGDSEVSYTVSKIDKVNSVMAQATVSNVSKNSFTLDIKGKDEESGISKIKVYVNNELKKTYNYRDNLNEEKNEKFTLDSLVPNTKYTYYIEVEDMVGNVSSTKNIDESTGEDKTDTIITSSIGMIEGEISHTPTDWTNKNVMVTINLKGEIKEGLKLKYRIISQDGKLLKDYTDYTTPFEVDKNAIVKATLSDGENTTNEIVDSIKNIDKDAPNIVTSVDEEKITKDSFEISIKAKDEGVGISKIKVYVNDELKKTYEYTKDLNSEKQEVFTLSNLEKNTSYNCKIEVEDKLSNKKTVDEINVKTKGDIEDEGNNNNNNNVNNENNKKSSVIITPSTDKPTDRNITITIKQNKEIKVPEDVYIEYKIEDLTGNVIKEYTKYGKPFKVDKNCVIKARLTNGTYVSKEVTYRVNNIREKVVNTSDEISIVVIILSFVVLVNMCVLFKKLKKKH